jgi:polyisoprenoid-binding protein YceI
MFKSLIGLLMTFGLSSLARAEATAYIIDTEHTSLGFEVPHLVNLIIQGIRKADL